MRTETDSAVVGRQRRQHPTTRLAMLAVLAVATVMACSPQHVVRDGLLT
jgi:hypothetical protein